MPRNSQKRNKNPKKVRYNAAEREGLAIEKMQRYSLDRPAGRFQAKHPQMRVELLARPSLEQMQETLQNTLSDFDRMIKEEKNRLK